ncbi:hypothetical protein GE21DRAFT_1113190 [Neurospora crassa]|nr:hypothetical protein GE21DRAFT_1113190 [Neurospora crassa]
MQDIYTKLQPRSPKGKAVNTHTHTHTQIAVLSCLSSKVDPGSQVSIYMYRSVSNEPIHPHDTHQPQLFVSTLCMSRSTKPASFPISIIIESITRLICRLFFFFFFFFFSTCGQCASLYLLTRLPPQLLKGVSPEEVTSKIAGKLHV